MAVFVEDDDELTFCIGNVSMPVECVNASGM
jgi:hypothetical protein